MGPLGKILVALFSAWMVAGAWPCAAEPESELGRPAPVARPQGDVTFLAALDLPQQGDAYRPQLRGGQNAVPTEWPASFYFKFPTADGPRACTAALIGPRVMLTAAHCLPISGTVSFQFGRDSYTTKCAPHPAYPRDPSADFALCEILDKPFNAPEQFKYESIQKASMSAAVGKDKFVLLTGFGCRGDRVDAAQNFDGEYQIGYAEIDESSASATKRRGAEYYAPIENNNLFTVYDDSVVHANLCPGDSGGPAFILTGGNGPVTQFRAIIAVNSRTFYNKTGTRYRDSLLSATGGPDFRVWATRWLGDKLKACGFERNPGSSLCR